MNETPDALDRFEKEAAEFCEDVNWLAPGKDEIQESSVEYEREEVRRMLFDAWRAGRKRESLRARAQGRAEILLDWASDELAKRGNTDLYRALLDRAAQAEKEAQA